MATDRKHDDSRPPVGDNPPPGVPTYTAGGGGAQLNQQPPAQPVKGGSQKSQIAQYFKSQGRQPDDEVWSVNGLSLKLSDLE